MENKQFTVKRMQTGEQWTVAAEALLDKFSEL